MVDQCGGRLVVLTARAIPLVLCSVTALADGSIYRSVDRSVDSHRSLVPSVSHSVGQTAGATTVVRVTAERFAFTPSEIVVEQGTTVEFHLTSEDTDHGFRIVGTNINAEIPKRRRGEAVVRYTAETAGRFTIECSRPCGAGHTAMQASLVVK
jgi:cytochrome c oxidase subunit II